MAGLEIASAYVSILPSTRDWDRTVKKDLSGRSVDIDVGADTSSATTDLEKWRTREGRNKVSLKVDVDSRGASSELRGLRRDFEMLGRSDALRLNLGASAITGLPMLAAGLAEVASAIQQVAQAGLALPGIFAGAASSIGTLTFGLTGIKDAYDALSTASDEASSSGGAAAAQARAQQSASYSLRNAIQDETQARKDVAQATRDARRELVDLNIEMRGGVISEKRAILEAQRAREQLLKGGFQSASDYQDAMLRVEEADQRVLEVRARNSQTAEQLADANSKGVAGSDLVVAANERLVRSEQQVATAQAASADAAGGSAAQQKAADAMGKLSANGQEFVSALIDATGPVMELRNLVQDNIFAGMAGQLKTLTGKAMPTFEKGLGKIGDAWNGTLTELFEVAGKDENLSMLDRIFGNTADAQTRMNDALDPLIEGIGVLTAAGSDALPRLADAFVSVSERFSDFITIADEDGRLAGWIDEGITAMGNLGEIALNVGKMFTGITEAADGSLLENLVKWTNTWQEWLNSTEGQDTLTGIFADGKAMFEQWKPIIEDIPGLFRGVYDAAQLYIVPLLELVDGVTSLLSDHPELVKLAAGAYVAFKVAGAIGMVSDLSTKLTGVGTSLVGMPDKASKAAKGINAAFALIVVPAIGEMINAEIQSALEGTWLGDLNNTWTPDQAGKAARDWFDKNVLGEESPVGGGGSPGSPANTNDLPYGGGSPLDPTGGLLSATANDGLKPGISDIKKTIEQKFPGLTIGGYNGNVDQPWDEHATGEAIDVMIPPELVGTPEGQALGDQIVQQALAGGGSYALWGQKQWNPDGSSSGMDDRGSVTENHGDHVHIRRKTYDTGGPLPPGTTVAQNNTGKNEFVLTPEDIEYLKKNGIDPASIQQQSVPFLPNEELSPEQQVEQWATPVSAGRTEGYIPAGAGYSGKTGGGVVGGFIDMGAGAIKGAIDMAAQAAKMGMAAGTMGASAAAGPAAGMGIDMAASAGKRMVDWGADMANIGVGALSEILLPFGAPRWLSDVDPTSFMPQMGINPALTTTGEQAFQAVADQQGLVDPNTTQHGTGAGGAPGPVEPAMPTQPDVGALNRVARDVANVNAPPPPPSQPLIGNAYVADYDELGRTITKGQNLAALQHTGRP